ncbi:MAG: Fe-S cluster assembly ATPase SufC [Candidatus Mycalebacterium zealandia]|nr:MAG: Fe-S cluster assembly ATPase SufC [Candidatus Mycalebacterium zealandia]
MLEIKNLHAAVDGKKILKGLRLKVGKGEIHSIMGPNGSGKSTLSQVLAGKDAYEVTKGSVGFEGEDLLDMEPEERSAAGVFMAFQYPIEIPGVSNSYLLREGLNSIRKHRGEKPVKHVDFSKLAKQKMKNLDMDDTFLSRPVNEGFSGGEKKRNEIFQMQILEPKLAILDETDSGLDIDALKIVAKGVNSMRSKDRSFIIITHYQRLLEYIVPDFVHVMSDGKIVKSGGKELALELESKGYGWIEKKSA